MLREVYIRSPYPEDLVRTNRILRDSLEEEGPVYGREVARDRLARALPEYFDEEAVAGSVGGPRGGPGGPSGRPSQGPSPGFDESPGQPFSSP